MRRIAYRVLPALVAAGALSASGACVAQAGSVKAHTAATTIKVTAVDFKFKLSASSVKKPGKVIFKVVNKGQVNHDFSIDGKTSKLVSPGKSTTLTVKFAKKGSFYYECTVAGHASLGMKGYFTVK